MFEFHNLGVVLNAANIALEGGIGTRIALGSSL